MDVVTQNTQFEGTSAIILCCICGCEIQYNSAGMCVSCLRSRVDISEGINTQVTIHSCRNCGRFLSPPWQEIQLESKELMAVCLRKIAGLSKVKLIDAVWIWTEPHSLRLKIKLTVQKEVTNGAILQQALIVSFTIRNQQCDRCQASFAEGAWHSVVQVRQRVSHKRTFFFLEQILLKHNAHADCVNIVTFKDGMDFYFADKQHGARFVSFLECHVPTKCKYSRKLVSADHSDNCGNFKHNHLVEVAPLCKDDLIFLPKDLANNLSNISRFVLVKNVAAGIHILDPFTCEKQEISSDKYWRYGFGNVMNSRQLCRYVVLSVELMHVGEVRPSAKRRGGVDKKMKVAEVTVAREKDLGVNDVQFTCTTHLGHVLKEGDVALGYDLATATWAHETGADEIMGHGKSLPDVLLVRKHYPTKGERKWALRQLEVDEKRALNAKETEVAAHEYEEFLQEIEADKEMRKNINLYKSTGRHAPKKKKHVEEPADIEVDVEDVEVEGEGDDENMIQLDELLDEMMLNTDATTSASSNTTAGVDNSAVATDAALEAESKVLSPQDIAAQAGGKNFDAQVEGFNPATYDPKDFKFT